MRMRRKKNLDTRLAEVADRVTNMVVEDRRFGADSEKEWLNYATVFGNDRPVELEIGCGKGGFIVECAKRHPEKNFLAVEKYANVLVSAVENAESQGVKNVWFLWGDAEYLPRFLPPHSLDRLYLNFSTPFPKKKQITHRLTHSHFLSLYRELLKDGACIIQKTDNRPFFQYSLEEFSKAGYTLQEVSLDLHADLEENPTAVEENIITEYEQKFLAQGLPIYRLCAK